MVLLQSAYTGYAINALSRTADQGHSKLQTPLPATVCIRATPWYYRSISRTTLPSPVPVTLSMSAFASFRAEFPAQPSRITPETPDEIYPVHVSIRKSFGEMTRKLSDTASQ